MQINLCWKIFLLINLSLNIFTNKFYFNESKLEKCREKTKHGFFKFAMESNGNLTIKKELKFKGICFNNITAVLTDEGSHFEINFKGSNKNHLLCQEVILVSNYVYVDYKIIFLGSGSLKIKKRQDKFNNNIYANGLRILTLCDSVSKNIKNILETLKLFLGGFGTNPNIPIFGSHVPQYQVDANLELIEMFNGYKYKKLDKVDTVNFNDFKPGDVIMITRFDGVDNIIGIGTGSRIGHTTMVLKDEEEDELYVYESQHAWYWPKTKIQRNKLTTWVKWADNADFNVVWLPLSEEVRKKFDNNKAKKFADSLLGLEYGYRNFLFGWIDTKDKNFPYIIDMEFIFILFKIIEKIDKKISDLIFTEAVNYRLNTKNKSLEEISEILVERNLLITDILPIVEKEGIEYSTGKSYVCSSYVSAVLREGNAFGDIHFNATEVTPRDLYTLNIYNKKEIKDCGNKFYCQFLGKYKLELDQYSTRDAYNNMYEKCESQAPLFNYNSNC